MATSRSSDSASKPGSRAARATLALTVFFGMLALSSSASAEELRVVLREFKGPGADSVQKSVKKVVRAEHKYISGKRYDRTARKMGAKRQNNKNVRKVARKLRADAVVEGKVVKKKGRYRITLRVRSGKTGRYVGEVEVTSRKRKPNKKAQRKLKRELLAVLRDIEPAGSSRRDPEPVVEREPDREPERISGDGDGDSDPDEVPDRISGDGDGDGDDDRDDDEPLEIESSLTDGGTMSSAVEVTGGLTLVKRDLSFNSSGNLGPAEPRGYSGGLVPAIGIDGEVYPLAFGKRRGGLANLGLSLSFEKVLLIRTELPEMPGVNLPTDYVRFGAGVVYRLRFGDGMTAPTLKLGAGIHRSAFTIEAPQGTNIDVPNVQYVYVDPGANFRYPFTERLRGVFVGRFLYALSAGSVEDQNEYGSANVFGFNLNAGVEFGLTDHLTLNGGLRFNGFIHRYDGSGNKTDRDNDGTQDVSGAFDSYLGGYLTAGYSF